MSKLLALSALFLAAIPAFAADPAQPNIVLMYADDLGYGDIGCFGSTLNRTPHLDQMAKDGIRLTDFYVAQAVCSASRTALLTGCYPNRVGILGALGPASKNGISDKEMTLAQVLKQRGYATAIYGKWHLGHQPQFLPTRHGFDDYFGLPYSNDMWPSHPTSKFPDLPLIEMEKTIEKNPDQTKLVTWYTDRAVNFIEKNRDKPFFVYVPHNMPHVPLFVSNKHKGKSKNGLYGDVIEEIDWSMGQILATLKKHNLEENTLVIFASDNGPWLSYGPHSGLAGPLREGKGTNFEGGVRVPFVARWTGKIPSGKTCSTPAMTIDVLPTIAAFAGAELPKLKIDGKDIGPLLLAKDGAKSPQEAYYFYWGRELQALRAGKWKLHFPHEYRTVKGKVTVEGKPAAYANAKVEMSLFDLENDIGETTNLADKHPEVVERLQKLADTMSDELGDIAAKKEGTGVRPAGMVK
jgi:arylsulfatase A-like enzyme